MLRVCVIGLGSAGNLHAGAYSGGELSQLVGVCDTDTQRAQAAASRLGVPAFADAREMLAALSPDLVSVCGGDAAFAPVMQALERGCHVLCEVPVSRELAHVREMVAAARARGLCLAANFNHRFTPAAVKARQWIDEARLGTPLFINTALWGGEPAPADPEAFLWRLACHGFDLMRYLCGDFARVQCFAAKAPGRRGRSSAQVNVQFASRVVGNLTVSCDMPSHHPIGRCEVAGTTARLVVDNVYEEVTLYPHAEDEKTVITDSVFGGLGSVDETIRCRIHRLLEQLTAGVAADEIEGSGEDALAAHVAIEAAIKSLESGDVVRMHDLGGGT